MQLSQMEWIDNRIALLDAAEELARQDNNPKNRYENDRMIDLCVARKIELINVKLMTIRP